MRDLRHYRAKRHPERTPEPFGEERGAPAGLPAAFVVQQHAARRMHWDLRLEIEDVLVSWAVPRGPSLDPAEKRLAVRTEDHPLEYADFEGVIPSGNYGAGAMIVWDRGLYRTVDGVTPADGLEKGKLDLLFEGHKLRGRFALVRTKRGEGKDWLLIRKGTAPEEGAEIAEVMPASVLSGLTVEELREGVSRSEVVAKALRSAKAPRKKLDAAKQRPMLASTGEKAFSRDGWLFELKYDGVRVIASKQGAEVHLFARTGADRTATYPEVARALAHLPLESFAIDGEIVALDETGRASFERIQRRFTQTDRAAIEAAQREIPVVFYVFDLLAAEGFDTRGLPLSRRKEILSLFAPRDGFVRFADHVEGDGEALFEAARSHDLEGVIAKEAGSRYEAGRRSKRWIKVKVPRSADLAIVGYLRGRGSRASLGSVMLAWRGEDGFTYAGNAGSGLDDGTIEILLRSLEPIDEPAFEGAPDSPVAGGHWRRGAPREAVFVKPELVCEVGYTEVTSAGLLRHPVFRGLRDDKTPSEADAAPASHGTTGHVSAGGAAPEATPANGNPGPDLELTRLDKVFWPVEGYTKGDLLAYYEAIWPWLAPYLRDRPVVLTRYPDGIDGKSFYQKNAPDFTPEWARRENIEGTDYFVCNDLRTLLYLINSGAIPLHVWSARLTSIEQPDWLILDLDPKEAPFAHVVEVTRHIHRLLDDLAATHFVKTSGQDGLHVLLPLEGSGLDHGQAKALGEVLARAVCADLPEIATIVRPVAARGDKVYVDYLQNGRGKLIAAPFSVRPRPGAPISMPLTWAQVTARLDPSKWNLRTGPKRMKKHGDPMADVLGEGVDVEKLLTDLTERLGAAD